MTVSTAIEEVAGGRRAGPALSGPVHAASGNCRTSGIHRHWSSDGGRAHAFPGPWAARPGPSVICGVDLDRCLKILSTYCPQTLS